MTKSFFRSTLSAIIFLITSNTIFSQNTNWRSNPFEHFVFVENKGQFDKEASDKNNPVYYQASSGGVEIYFTANGLTYKYDEVESLLSEEEREELDPPETGEEEDAKEFVIKETKFLQIEWVGANPLVDIVADELQTFYYTYPAERENFQTTLKAQCYKKITYKNLYPNIDVEYILPEKGGVKYTLILHPGANASQIKMRYNNASALYSGKDGNIIIDSEFGRFVDHAPVSYHELNKSNVESVFILDKNEVSFKVDDYNKSQTLIIDPWISNPTFGGTNKAFDINYDAAGNVYVYGAHNPYKLSKFNSAGVFQWTYNATLFSGGTPFYYYGDFAVDEQTGESYIVEAFTQSRVLRINTLGSQTGISPAVGAQMNEMWRIEYNRCTKKIVIAAGGTNNGPYNQATMLDVNTFTTSPVNVLGASTRFKDMALLATDPYTPFCYMLVARDPFGINNNIIKCPVPNLIPTSFSVYSGHVFWEGKQGDLIYRNTFGGMNGFNGMACSPNYLYTYDGLALKKWDKNTGAWLGQGSTGGVMFTSSGLTADECDNIYAGVGKKIIKYNSSFNQIATYNLPDTCYDLKLGPNNKLYACGKGFVSEILITTQVQTVQTVATPATNCGTCNGVASVIGLSCGSLSNYDFIWSPGGQTTQSIAGLCPGTYTVTLSSNCRDTLTTQVMVTGGAGTLSLSSNITNAGCANNNGSVTITPAGGSIPYTYSWSIGGQAGQTATGLSPGTYTVTVTDNSGCFGTSQIVNITGTGLTHTTSTNVSCTVNNNSATINVSGGSLPYTYVWFPSGGSGATASGLPAGAYTVSVSDAGGCTLTDPVLVTGVPFPQAFSKSPDFLICRGGTVNLSTSVMVGASYSWTPSTGLSNANISNPVSSANVTTDYFLTVTNSPYCTNYDTIRVAVDTTVVEAGPTVTACIGGPTQLSAQIIGTPENVFHPCGTSTSCSGPNLTLTYDSIGPNGFTPFNGANTDYRMQLLYKVATLKTLGLQAGQINDLSFHVITKNSTQSFNGFTIKMGCGTNISFGAAWVTGLTIVYGPSNYTSIVGWNTFALTPSFNWDGSSDIVVEICWDNTTTSAGADVMSRCFTGGGAVLQYNSSTTNAQSGCSFPTIGGSAGAFTPRTRFTYCKVNPLYVWSPSGGLSDTSILNPVANVASSTTYTLTVSGLSGCSKSDVITINVNPCGLTAQATGQSVCSGACAAVSASALSGTTPYTYSWSTGQSGQTINVCPSVSTTYTITVTDSLGNTTTDTAEVFIVPLLTSSPSVIHVSCNGQNTGTASANPGGGSAPYTYSWSSGSSQLTASQLIAGTYTVTIHDALGCVTDTVVNITEPVALSVTSNTATANCNQGSGSAMVNPSGGIAPYTYLWSASVATTQQISNLSSGTYSVAITDNNRCAIATAITVGNMPGVTAQLISSNSASCFGLCNGTASVGGSGGTTPYTYLWSNNQSTAIAGNLCATAFTATITDAAGCFSTANISITEPSPIKIQSTATHVQCNGDSTGNASINVTGGTAPYTYSWSAVSGGTQSAIGNLQIGNYTITLTDASGCNTDTIITITEPPALSYSLAITDASCGNNNGTATIRVTGGTPGYFYFWPAASSNDTTITNLGTGTYSVIVTDNNNCTIQASGIVNNPGGLTATIISVSNVSCNVTNDGSATVSVSGGTAPYTYFWSSSSGGSTAQQVSNLIAGSYTVIVTDNNGCTQTQTISITQPIVPVAAISNNDSICPGETITLSASGGASGGISYVWSTGETTSTNNQQPITNSIYTVTVSNGSCSDSDLVQITVFPYPIANAGNDSTIAAGQNITLTATTTTGNTYLWSTGETISTINQQPTITTTYILSVTDANGCNATDTVTIFVENSCDDNAEVFVPNSFSPNGDGQNDVLQLYSTGTPETIYFAIYSRWGEKVFECTDLSTTWDGVYKSKTMDTAVFSYLLKITCKTQSTENIKTGNISLMK